MNTIQAFLREKREDGSMTLDVMGVRCDMKLIMESKTKSPLNSIQFLVKYDDGTMDVYEHKLF